MEVFFASFIGSFLSLGIVGTIVISVTRRDIKLAQREAMEEMERGRSLMAAFLAASNAAVENSDGSNETVQ